MRRYYAKQQFIITNYLHQFNIQIAQQTLDMLYEICYKENFNRVTYLGKIINNINNTQKFAQNQNSVNNQKGI